MIAGFRSSAGVHLPNVKVLDLDRASQKLIASTLDAPAVLSRIANVSPIGLFSCTWRRQLRRETDFGEALGF
jgi:hypothetical protein